MKRFPVVLICLTATFFVNAQNVGIGTTTPDATALLHVYLGTSSTQGLLVNGNYNGASIVPNLGAGSRMMFYPGKSAFRAGYVTGTEWDNINVGFYSTAMGSATTASGNSSTAMGYFTNASGFSSTAMGGSTTASGNYSTATGSGTTASGYSSTAMGVLTIASNDYSVAMGYSTTASGFYSTAMGNHTTASGYSSTAMGSFTTASGFYPTAMGYNTIASADVSTAMGSFTTASGVASTAMGENSISSGNDAFAGGHYSNAAADYTFALGESVTANSYISTSLGRHNDPIITSPTTSWVLTEPLLIVGNGTGPSDKKNAFAIAKNGKIYIDPSNKNDGTLSGNTLLFGTFNGTGEGIGSKRTAGANQYGLDFWANNLIRMSITNGGNVGIGITNPNAPLGFPAVLGKKITLYPGATGDVGMAVQGNQFLIYSDNPNASVRLGYDQAGVFQYNLDVNGNGNATLRGTLTQNSDIRLKKDIHLLKNSLQHIIQLNGYSYYWKDKNSDQNLQTGVLAQEVQKIVPQLVTQDKDGMLSVNYSGLIPLLIESIKEQQIQIDELKKLVQSLINK